MAEAEKEEEEDFLSKRLRWIYPGELRDHQEVVVYCRGLIVIPFLDDIAQNGQWGAKFVRGLVHRIFNEEEELIAIQVGAYRISPMLFEHPRITAIVEDVGEL